MWCVCLATVPVITDDILTLCRKLQLVSKNDSTKKETEEDTLLVMADKPDQASGVNKAHKEIQPEFLDVLHALNLYAADQLLELICPCYLFINFLIIHAGFKKVHLDLHGVLSTTRTKPSFTDLHYRE